MKWCVMNIGSVKNLPETYFRKIEFTTQLGCSVGCTYCPQDVFIKATKGEERILSRDTVKSVLENIKGSPIREVQFSGFSEPFLHPECGDFMLMSYEAGFEVSVFSTLKGLNRVTLEKIKDIPIKLFHISVQVPGSRLRPGIDDDYIWRQVDLLLSVKNRFYIRFGCVDTIATNESKLELKRRLRERGFNIIYGDMLDRAGNLPEGKSKHHPKTDYLICLRNIGFVILPNGDACWCSMDYSTRHRVGNLRNKPYNEIICSPIVQSMLRSMTGSQEMDNLLCHQCESACSISKWGSLWLLFKGKFFPTRVNCSGGGF